MIKSNKHSIKVNNGENRKDELIDGSTLTLYPNSHSSKDQSDIDKIEKGSSIVENHCEDYKETNNLLGNQKKQINSSNNLCCGEVALCITSIAIRKWLSVFMICGFGVTAVNLCLMGSESYQHVEVEKQEPYVNDWSEQIPNQYNMYSTFQPLWTMSSRNSQYMPMTSSQFGFAQYSGIARTEEEKSKALEQSGARGESWAWVERVVPKRGPVEKWVEKKMVNPGKEGTLVDQNSLGVSDLNGYKDVWDPHENGDQAVFWHIAKAGGSTIKNVLGTCHRFTLATEAGIRKGHDLDTKIAVVRPNSVKGQDSTPFVNVDPTTIHGLERAARMGLAESNLADAIVTPFFHHAEILFQDQNRGRLFSVFRNPVERSISMFYYLQIATWEETYNPEFQKMTLLEFAQSELVEDNWMVRRLSNTIRGKLNEDHFKTAIDVIRRKFLVGTLRRLEESLERFEKFFGWKFRVNPPNQENCRTKLLNVGANQNTKKQKEDTSPGSKIYELLSERNLYDLRLYEYVENLFDEQAQFVNDIPDGFRNIDASCSKCVPPTFPKILDLDEL